MRNTGRTTRIAVGSIAAAMTNEGEWIYMEDHHGTKSANLHLIHQVMMLISKMELKGFTFNRNAFAIRYTQPSATVLDKW